MLMPPLISYITMNGLILLATPFSLLLVPHVWLGLKVGNTINLALNFLIPMLVLYKYRVGIVGILAVYLCPTTVVLVAVNNIDWVPLLGLLLPPWLGTIFVCAKPQGIGGVVLIWIKRYRWRVMLSVMFVGVVTLAIWGVKPIEVAMQADVGNRDWNFAPFPLLVWLGVWMLWKAWREDDMVMAGAATPLLVPYIGGYSMIMPLTLLATKYPRVAAGITIMMWWFFVVATRRWG